MKTVSIGGRLADIDVRHTGVLVFHGATGNRKSLQFTLALDTPYTTIYLDGTPNPAAYPQSKYWNAGRCCGYASDNNIDDVSYIDAVIAYSGFTDVYMVGHSNGGMLIYKYLLERPNVVKKAVIISGTLMSYDYSHAINTGPDTTITHIHGLSDTVVPYNGGINDISPDVYFLPIREVQRQFIDLGYRFNLYGSANGTHNIEQLNTSLVEESGVTLHTLVSNALKE